MIWFVVGHFVAFFVDLVVGTRPGTRDKDLQIFVLRHQVRLLQRQLQRPPRLTRGEKLTLAVLTAALTRLTTGLRCQLDQYLLLFKPDTILKWHRELVRRKWIYRRTHPGGRPAIPAEVEALILRLARENARWGHRRIQGEQRQLGHAVSASAVRAALRRHRVPPAVLAVYSIRPDFLAVWLEECQDLSSEGLNGQHRSPMRSRPSTSSPTSSRSSAMWTISSWSRSASPWRSG